MVAAALKGAHTGNLDALSGDRFGQRHSCGLQIRRFGYLTDTHTTRGSYRGQRLDPVRRGAGSLPSARIGGREKSPFGHAKVAHRAGPYCVRLSGRPSHVPIHAGSHSARGRYCAGQQDHRVARPDPSIEPLNLEGGPGVGQSWSARRRNRAAIRQRGGDFLGTRDPKKSWAISNATAPSRSV